MNHSGMPPFLRISTTSSAMPLPLRTFSIVLKESKGSMPLCMRYIMMSSRAEMAFLMVHWPLLMRSWALPSQTSVPWEKPDMRTRSEKTSGCVSSIIWRVNGVRNSGMPKVPLVAPSSSGVTPRAVVELKMDMVAASSNGMVFGSRCVRSSSILMTVGSSWPRMSSLTSRLLMEW